MASSTDGYCTIVKFDNGELGVPLANSELPVGARKMAATNIDFSPPIAHTPVSTPSSNQTTPRREVSQVAPSAENSLDGANRKPGPRRVQLITLSTTPQSVSTPPPPTTTQHNTSGTGPATSTPTSNTDTVVIL